MWIQKISTPKFVLGYVWFNRREGRDFNEGVESGWERRGDIFIFNL
jgi:hypothetical protein